MFACIIDRYKEYIALYLYIDIHARVYLSIIYRYKDFMPLHLYVDIYACIYPYI